MKGLQRFANTIDRLNETIGKGISWATFFLMVVVCIDVVRRLIFKKTAAWILELEWHLFAILFLLGAGYTFLHNRHVRVDVFYSKMNKRDKAWVNIIGILVLLLPWCSVLIYWSIHYAWQSFAMSEGSPNPNGLTVWWPIKFMIPVGMCLLAAQGLSELAKNIIQLDQQKKQNS